MATPRAHPVRYTVDPMDIPAEKAARRLHLTVAQFESLKDALFRRGFPRPDPDTGMYDLEAIDIWRRRRQPALYDLTPPANPEQASAGLSLRDRLREAKGTRGHG